jgi:hypothetical protein
MRRGVFKIVVGKVSEACPINMATAAFAVPTE